MSRQSNLTATVCSPARDGTLDLQFTPVLWQTLESIKAPLRVASRNINRRFSMHPRIGRLDQW